MIADLFYIKKSAKYKEKGLFATQFIPIGTVMDIVPCRKCGTYSKEEFAKLSEKERHFVMDHEVMEKSGLWSKLCDKRLSYDNHSCNANTLGAGKGFGIVVRDIKKGEEATSDYRQGQEKRIRFVGGCKCGERNCMGKTTFRPPVPKRLQRFWSAKTNAALRRIPYVKQPLKRELLKEHPELSYLFVKDQKV